MSFCAFAQLLQLNEYERSISSKIKLSFDIGLFQYIFIARPEMTKVVIDSVHWEEDDGKILSRAMSKRKFLGPKSYYLAKKRKVLKALGASVCVNNFRKGAPYSCFQRRPLEIGLFYYMLTLYYRR